MLHALLVSLHILVSVILILVVLLQTGKSADLAGAFGGGGSQTAFGSRGAATFLSKMTTSAAIIFMLTSFTLAIMSARGRTSVLDQAGVPEGTAPVTPIAAPADQPVVESPPAGSDATGPPLDEPAAGGESQPDNLDGSEATEPPGDTSGVEGGSSGDGSAE